MKKLRIKIGKKSVGDGLPVYIIAEAASNHNKNFKKALKLIDLAKEAGCDAIKFQLFKADKIYNKYILKKYPNLKFTYRYFQKNNLPEAWLPKLKKYCDKKKIEFLCTPFYPKAVELLAKINVAAFKIASMDLLNFLRLKQVASFGKPIILANGFSYMNEIKQSIDFLKKVGNKKIIMLHNVSAWPYPVKVETFNLKVISEMRKKFKVLVGLSDHTEGIIAPVVSVALGGCMIEKHITLDKKTGFDHNYCADPEDLKEIVNAVRMVEKGLGNGVKKPVGSEIGERVWARPGLYAVKTIEKGTKITEKMLETLRPNPKDSLGAEDVFKVIGKKAKVDIKKGEPIKKKSLLRGGPAPCGDSSDGGTTE